MSKRQYIGWILTVPAIIGIVGILRTKSKKNTTPNNSTMPNTTTSSVYLPRGYRNNNPLNIRINAANNWQGKITPNTDGSFEQFISMAYGYRAAMSLIRTYITKYSCRTIAQIISKWAPNNENNTTGYINRVCSTTGYTPDTVINPDNQTQMSNLVYAMSLVENGNKPLPDIEAIQQAWNMYIN